MDRGILLVRGLIVGLAAALFVGAVPASATFQGADGKIFFVSDRDGNNEIYSMDAMGGNQTNLTNNAADDGQTFGLGNFTYWEGPSLSPDGKKVAFTRKPAAGNRDIWVMDANGSNPTQLTNNAADDYMPTFTATGKITFVSDRDPGGGVATPNLWQMDANGGNTVRLTTTGGGESGLLQPDIFPTPPPELYTGIAPSTPPLGTLLIYIPGGNRATVNMEGGITPEFGTDGSGNTAIWYSGLGLGGNFDLFRSPLSGSGANVTSTASAAEVDPAQAPSQIGQPTAAPLVAYASNPGDDWDIYLSGTPLTTNTTTNDTAPEWQAVDQTPPNTQIDSGPTGDSDGQSPYGTNERKPTFTFSSTEANSTFKCSIDDGTEFFTDCNGNGTPGSHTPSAGLADGDYTFKVRATDAAGNPDPTPATRTFTVDTQGPTVEITAPKHKIKTTKKRVKVTLEFEASEAMSTFKCKLDTGAEEDCVSGDQFTLKVGKHTFTVTATDQWGNKGPGPTYDIKIIKK